ncbi:MAG: ATP-binding protein [Bacteroidales bacterium]|nr:ATP-binding protein [Bacteroidales bacterium]
MKRLITNKLLAWKDKKNRKPLIIRGARQIGKSHTITEFGKKHFKNKIHIINLEQNPEYCSIFKKNFDTERIISELEIVLGNKINTGNDLLFIDEIQECPEAITSLRYFYENSPDLHVIAAGSLIEFALKDVSFPVGRVQILEMYPMNFYEFLLATENNTLAEKIISKPENLSDIILEKALDELHKYFIIGGMPECIKTYANSKSLIDVFEIQDNLISTFRQDFSKYSGHSDKRCLNSILTSISQNIGVQIKYTRLSDDFSSPTIKKAFELLETARLFSKVKASSPSGIPLGANASEKIFKAVFLDIGLLSRLNGYSVGLPLNKKNISATFSGMMAEQFVGQELLSAGHKELFYWSRSQKSSKAETDYLTEQEGKIIPIEVKSCSAGRLRSLHLLLETFKNIEIAYVFSENNFSVLPEQKLIFAPLFYVNSIFGKK